jgi:hypothetical protein
MRRLRVIPCGHPAASFKQFFKQLLKQPTAALSSGARRSLEFHDSVADKDIIGAERNIA